MEPSAQLPLSATQTARRLDLRIESDPCRVAEARRAMERFAADLGYSESAQADIGLCVNEALANVIRHAYAGEPGRPILIRAEYEASDATAPAIRLVIRDWGNGQDPARLPPKPRDPLVPGGVGMICLSGLMDEVTFSPQPDGMMLTMVKRK